IIKFLDNLFYSSSTLLLVLISLFLGYVTYFELSLFDFILITLFDLLPFIITAASLGVIVLLVLMKLASRIGIRPLIISLALIYAFFLFSFFKIVSPADLVIEVMKSYPNVDIFFGDLISPIIKLLPNQWFSESLYWTVRGDGFKSMNLIILQVIVAVITFSTALFLGKKWYYKTWLISFKFRRNTKKTFDKQMNFSSGGSAIIKKDIILFLREPGQLIHFIILMALTFIFMISVSGVKSVFFMRTEIQTIIYIVIFLFNTLLISTLSLRFIFPLISLEGLAFWKLKTAPIKVIKLVNVKLLPFFVLVSSAAVLLSFFSNYATSPHLILYSIIIFIFISFVLIMMNFGMGVIFSKFKEKSAIRIASSQGASLTFLFSLIYMVFLVLVISVPVYIHFDMIKRHNIYNYALLNGAALIIIIVSFLGGLFFYWLGIRSLKKDF
ncbi:MAG: hypothetical protein KAQ90_05395, partial [Melioribacteraceae bacterium]|nr:hypothetical protein [Melioribacteraceae bacterium]